MLVPGEKAKDLKPPRPTPGSYVNVKVYQSLCSTGWINYIVRKENVVLANFTVPNSMRFLSSPVAGQRPTAS